MGKVYPCKPSTSSCTATTISSANMYTIWMKSLVVNGNGYTVYDSNGKVVYRIDNYDIKCRNEVYLMDLQGNVLCTISRKKLLRFGVWDGYKGCGPKAKNQKPWFEVTNSCKFLKKDSEYRVIIGSDENQSTNFYKIGEMNKQKSEFKIINGQGTIVAEVKQKLSACGVTLGEDVLSLKVEPSVDQSFIMALVAVHGLLNNRM
ncbi:Tubby C-terminal-like domain-containing protein [Heracleum sosnowskyi]|uniref:Tubby C-terminal-like domain-containing protein n=1 Tax=Heracleum sosnowskyi TaxID=360622 RepID=A0AAD8GRR3_9APIA|nr:Tubby C-terminal-like domain-containing protein [Heracleum sosnowskyi]